MLDPRGQLLLAVVGDALVNSAAFN